MLSVFISSHEYARIMSDGHQVENHQDCSHIRGKLVLVPFGASNFLTSEVRIQNMESRVTFQFVVLRGGLGSGWFTLLIADNFILKQKMNLPWRQLLS